MVDAQSVGAKQLSAEDCGSHKVCNEIPRAACWHRLTCTPPSSPFSPLLHFHRPSFLAHLDNATAVAGGAAFDGKDLDQESSSWGLESDHSSTRWRPVGNGTVAPPCVKIIRHCFLACVLSSCVLAAKTGNLSLKVQWPFQFLPKAKYFHKFYPSSSSSQFLTG